MEYSDYIIYVDESGDHNLVNTDPNYPMFVLAFCIFRKTEYADLVSPSIQRFKFKHFGHDTVVLHEHEIRKQQAPFVFLKSRDKRAVFMQDINKLITKAPMTVIAAAIHKDEHKELSADPTNPYEVALTFCMERAYSFLNNLKQTRRKTHLVVECRGKKEDRDLELEFRRICDGANLIGQLDCFDIVFADKKANSGGLQLADLIARPIGIKILNPDQQNRAYEIIALKLRSNAKGSIDGFGLKRFP